MQPKDSISNINTLRYFATFLLVSYHVIGLNYASGMNAPAGSVWRLFSDALIDVRMPLFAFIAGAVYALRPITLSKTATFFTGKMNRLVVPGVIAALVFWVLCNSILNGGFAYNSTFLSALLLSMGHFWFLQAILLIFVVVGILDAVLNYRCALWMFAVSVALTFIWQALLVPKIPYLEITSAIYLAPYFLIGLVLVRHHDLVTKHRWFVLLGGAALFLVGVYLNLSILAETGVLSKVRLDLQSLCVGIGVILLAHLIFPKIGALDKLAVYSFTIYLYHPFGTSAVRRGIDALNYDLPLWVHFVLGVLAGLVLPCILHAIADRFYWSRRLLLGINRAVGIKTPANWRKPI